MPRTRKNPTPAAEPVAAEQVAAEPVAAEPVAAEPAKKPRKPRAKKVAAEAEAAAEPEPAAEPELAKKPRKPRAKKVVAAEVVAAEVVAVDVAAAEGERSAEVKPKRTRKPSAYNMLLGEFMRKIAQEEKEIPRNERMAKAQSMYRDWKSTRDMAIVAA